MVARRAALLLTFALASAGGCVSDAQDPSAGGQIAIDVAPLTLTSLTDATYTLRVVNLADELVWERTVTSSQYGDGAGSISYVGPCDADSSPNEVQLVLDELRDAGGALTEGADYTNPAPASSPLTLEVECLASEDVEVRFDVTFARAAQQGFFDVAVELVDVFCSAKLDCRDEDNAPLQLLFNGAQRDDTAVVAFACTGGLDADTHLYMSNLELTCGANTTVIDPTLGPGKLSIVPEAALPNPWLFDAMVTRGAEQLGSWNKLYWNVLLGMDQIDGCVLTARASASDGLMSDDGATPPSTTWPYLEWNATLSTCQRHALDSGDGVVTTRYTPLSGATFRNYFDGDVAQPFATRIAGSLLPAGPGLWEDGTYAASCDGYRHPDGADYRYEGATGDGWYTIDPDGPGGAWAPIDVWCDMTTDGGGWTAITNCDAESYWGGTLVEVDAGSVADILACSPRSRDGNGSHTYHYTFDFPAGYDAFYLSDYVARANAASGDTSDIEGGLFQQASWSAASGSDRGDVSFGTPDMSGPVASFARHPDYDAMVNCRNCDFPWPYGAQIFSVAATTDRFRIGMGESGGELEGWLAWYSGTVMLR